MDYLVNLVIELVQCLERVYILVDAVNESGDWYKILQSFESITKSLPDQANFHFFISNIQ